ncbi:hypothetical protein Pla110_26200 [Polystyrenella longa]|uniref:Uncharacterized protein n=1 Tax=Polystyrenella longa TaxID=2528007 RepID=A0A518CNW6_9PLAN|nr:hypothetical protein Pla110_26200 [Polystyrenella longa]
MTLLTIQIRRMTEETIDRRRWKTEFSTVVDTYLSLIQDSFDDICYGKGCPVNETGQTIFANSSAREVLAFPV